MIKSFLNIHIKNKILFIVNLNKNTALNSKTNNKMNFRTATSFEEAWNTCPINSLDNVLVVTSLSDPGAPNNSCNTWYVQQWKNGIEGAYSWIVAWSFSPKIYSKYSNGSGLSEWIDH